MKTYALVVRGRHHEWSFDVRLDPRYIQDYLDDGLVVEEIVATYPQTWIDLGLPCWLWDFLKGVKHDL